MGGGPVVQGACDRVEERGEPLGAGDSAGLADLDGDVGSDTGRVVERVEECQRADIVVELFERVGVGGVAGLHRPVEQPVSEAQRPEDVPAAGGDG